MGIAYDISDRKHSEELTTTMAHEVEHRAKNALAVVSSLLRMNKADSVDQFVRVMEGRVRALSETTALMGRGSWRGADLRGIVMSELTPFESKVPGDGFGIAVSGPPVIVEAAVVQPLSMALHELATNAAKYGALSRPEDTLSVDWHVEDERVHLVWRQSGGPPIRSSSQKSSFGSRLIKIMFEGQIGGRVEKLWEETGLVCKMSFPLTGKASSRLDHSRLPPASHGGSPVEKSLDRRPRMNEVNVQTVDIGFEVRQPIQPLFRGFPIVVVARALALRFRK